MSYIFNGDTSIEINDGAAWVSPDGTQYPANFPKDEIAGLTAIIETARPVDPLSIVTGSIVEIINGDPTRVWQSRLKTADELAVEASSAIKQQIAMLESQQTQRRVREATLGIDGGWLANLNNQIKALRSSLPSSPATVPFNPEVPPPE